jgi:hypothetical protein
MYRNWDLLCNEVGVVRDGKRSVIETELPKPKHFWVVRMVVTKET